MAKKDYLIQILQNDPDFLAMLQAEDIIEFEMPGFCSGDYSAEVLSDEFGLYIYSKYNYFKGCRDYFKKSKVYG